MPKQKKLIPDLRFPEFVKDGEWVERRLGEVAEKVQDGTHFSPKAFDNGDFLYITSKNVKNGYLELSSAQFISRENHENIYKRCDVKKGDVLLTKDGTIGQACVNELTIPFSLLSSVAFIRLKPDFSNYFLYHLLVSPIGQKEIKSQIAGQALKRITLTKINNFCFSFPSLQEQQKIASCLSSLDELIAAHGDKLELLKAHKKGLMQNLFPQQSASGFTGLKNEQNNNKILKFSNSENSDSDNVPRLRFPEFVKDGEWVERRLGEVAEFINGRAYKKEELLSKGKYRVLRVGNFFTNNEWYYSDLELDDNKYCNTGDLLYAWSASFGPRIWKEEKVIYHYHIWKVIEKEEIDKNFLFILLDFETENIKAAQANGLGMLHITKSGIESWESFMPPTKKEQQKIASCLSALDELIAAQVEKIAQLKQHKKGLMQGLFPKMSEL